MLTWITIKLIDIIKFYEIQKWTPLYKISGSAMDLDLQIGVITHK